jgi:hypothetical protein
MRQIIRQSRLLLLFSLIVFLHPATALSTWTWEQSDWSGSQYESADSINAEIEPGELVLENDPDRLVFAFDPTDYPGVYTLCEWADRLYLGASEIPMYVNGGDILVYDYATDTVTLDYTVYEQGIAVLKEHDGVLYSPGVDNIGSGIMWGNLYYNAGAGWVRKETIPYAVHVLDIAFRDNRIWVTTGTAPMSPMNGASILYSSDDMGDTWTVEFSVPAVPPETARRFYGATAWNGSMFVQGDGRLPEGPVVYELDGGAPITHSLPGMGLREWSAFVPFQGRLACLSANCVFFYDGETWSSVDVPNSSSYFCRGINVYRDRLYIGGIETFAASSDGEVWESLDASAVAGHEIEALAQHHGRLYAGTYGAEGDGAIFVTPAIGEGSLVSRPHSFPGPTEGGTLSWEALTPSAETTVSFQLRSATTMELLPAALFIGPDGSPGSWYESSGLAISDAHLGHRHFQYRVRLRTTQEHLAPVLTGFVLTVEGTPAGVPDRVPAAQASLAIWPNPFRAELNMRVSGAQGALEAPGGGKTLRVLDVSGRLIRELAIPNARASVVWDGRDASGTPVTAGVYFIELRVGDRSPVHERVVRVR